MLLVDKIITLNIFIEQDIHRVVIGVNYLKASVYKRLQFLIESRFNLSLHFCLHLHASNESLDTNCCCISIENFSFGCHVDKSLHHHLFFLLIGHSLKHRCFLLSIFLSLDPRYIHAYIFHDVFGIRRDYFAVSTQRIPNYMVKYHWLTLLI